MAWQQTARTPVAQRRSTGQPCSAWTHLARSSSRSWTREARADGPQSRTEEPADDVTAPSARQATGAALKSCRRTFLMEL